MTNTKLRLSVAGAMILALGLFAPSAIADCEQCGYDYEDAIQECLDNYDPFIECLGITDVDERLECVIDVNKLLLECLEQASADYDECWELNDCDSSC